MPSEESRLTDSERLAALDRDLLALHEYCRQSDLSPEEVRRALQPLVSAVNWSAAADTARSVSRTAAALGVVFAVVFLLALSKPVQQTAHTYTRIALVKILPYWDWTRLYDLRCLVENPMFEDQDRSDRTEDTCQLCESLNELERLSNASAASITENYLRLDRPVIVTDATGDWPAFRPPGVDKHQLIKIFSDSSLADAKPCMLMTNLKARNDMSTLLNKMANPLIKKWFAQWENCDKRAAKALRALYRRPYFIPAMVDTSDSNWVLVSSNYTGDVYKMLPVVNDMVWMAQLQGTSGVRLTARSPCTVACAEIVDTLRPGEILMFTDYMWMMEYVPGYGTDNIAIGTGGYWD